MHLAQLDKRARKVDWASVLPTGAQREGRGDLPEITHLSQGRGGRACGEGGGRSCAKGRRAGGHGEGPVRG